MAKIRLTPEELREKASTLRSTAILNDDVISKLDGIVNGLQAVWEGTAQTAFVESYNTKRTTFKSLTEKMEVFAKFLETFSTSMGQEEEFRTGLARGLAG